jgi:hypothetical protein
MSKVMHFPEACSSAVDAADVPPLHLGGDIVGRLAEYQALVRRPGALSAPVALAVAGARGGDRVVDAMHVDPGEIRESPDPQEAPISRRLVHNYL